MKLNIKQININIYRIKNNYNQKYKKFIVYV